ncbi:MAG TPA: hypothetical protein PLZ31_03795 [Myxococcota bacterium]|nr:hypothetical protein [Myxococcota bacterium]
MNRWTACSVMLVAAVLATSCQGRVSRSGALSGAGAAGKPVSSDTESVDGWSLAPAVEKGMLAISSVSVTIERGDAPVEMTDSSTLTILPGGDFRFSRSRIHKGAADGRSDESTGAIRVGSDYFTAGTSGLWVRWDDAIAQPRAQVRAFINDEDSLANLVRQCARLEPRDDKGVSRVSLASSPCRFATPGSGGPTEPWSGEVSALEGTVRLDGRVPLEIAVTFAFDSAFDSVAVKVGMTWNLQVKVGGDLPVVKAPEQFVESRRPRPVRMVESVLGELVDDWGPGAPANLAGRKSK